MLCWLWSLSTTEIIFGHFRQALFLNLKKKTSIGVNIKRLLIFFFLRKKKNRHWIMSNVAPCTDPSRLSAAICISVTVAPLGAQSTNTHKAWLLTLPVYTCQWARGAPISQRRLARWTVNWAGTVLGRTNRDWDVNFVWNFPGKSEFRGRALERVNRIPSFIRPLPEAISSRWKRELRYFLIRCICLNAHF